MSASERREKIEENRTKEEEKKGGANLRVPVSHELQSPPGGRSKINLCWSGGLAARDSTTLFTGSSFGMR